MATGRTVTRTCACGCGTRLLPWFDATGRDCGYRKLTPGHRRRPSPSQHAAFERARAARLRPIGSRRLQSPGKGKTRYWLVKVRAKGRWALEHRVIVSARLGRPLLSSEFVHHLDGDGLNNIDENLVLMGHGDHSRLTSLTTGFGHWDRTAPHRCPCCGWFHDPSAPAPL